MMKGKRRIQPNEIQKIAQFLGISEMGVLALMDGHPEAVEARRRTYGEAAVLPGPSPVPVAMRNEPPREGRPDIPVWASAEGGDEGALILMPEPIDYIYRSERMRGVQKPFAFQIIGSSMSPALEHGDQAVVNPALLPRPGVSCVFIQERGDGTFRALVKRLLRSTADHWKVRQFDPERDFDLSKRKWPRAHVIAEIRKAGL